MIQSKKIVLFFLLVISPWFWAMIPNMVVAFWISSQINNWHEGQGLLVCGFMGMLISVGMLMVCASIFDAMKESKPYGAKLMDLLVLLVLLIISEMYPLLLFLAYHI